MIERNDKPSMRRVRVCAWGTSALTLAAVLASPAFAQCAPEPAAANGTVTCRGTDADGVRIITPSTTLNVAIDANVSNTAGPAITVEVPTTIFSTGTTVTIAGRVTGGAQSGISLLTGGQSGGQTTRLALSVASGAALSGSTALTLGQTAGSGFDQLVATLDNGGTITGASGVALRGDVATMNNGFTTSYSGFSSIVNRAGGTINGSIVGPIGTLTNAGLIEGGAAGALTTGNAGTSIPFFISPGTWSNTGTIRSNGSAATIASATIGTLTNAGTIANAGSGAALSSANLVVQNQATGRITSGGTVAINGTGFVNLVNRGTIIGGVVTGNASSTIDSSQGRINGSVTFGSGNDTLIVRYDGTATPVTGITGVIATGGGTNTQQVAIGANTTIATPVTLLSGFQQLAFATERGTTTTLGTGFVAPGTIQLIGAGALVNRAAIATAGTAFALNGVFSPDSQRFVNEGSIQTGSTTAFAITTGSGFSQIVNNGTITSAGGGINSSQSSVVNTGQITAAGGGVTLFGNGLTNNGIIRSTSGVGAQLSGNVGTVSTNNVTIQGATAGVQTSGYLTNAGTITATGSGGTAVRLDAYGVLFNNVGGVVGNGGQAVTGTSFNQSVVNAGTINGTVSFSSSFQNGNSQRYISQGGTLNGNLVLGADGLLFTDLANTGPGQFAGITGTVVAASGAQLRYRVTGTQSATIGPIGPFAIAAYELTPGASLTLTAPAAVTRQLVLVGTGSVDLSADFRTSSAAAALTVTNPLSTNASISTPTGALAITSRGTIAVTRAAGAGFFAATGVVLGSNDSFTNAGTIAITDRVANSGSVGILAQVGGTITNAGTILLDGGAGISGGAVTNSGAITQVEGGVASRGILGARSLHNSGTIRVGGIAVTASNGTEIANTGTIASTGGIAIGGTSSSTSATITNAAGGTIAGNGTAVRLFSGTFTNAGTVIGTVDMGFGFPFFSGSPTRSFASSTYVADGGTIAGNLLFGSGADTLVSFGALEVSGRIDGGEGVDRLIQARRASGTVTLDLAGVINFEEQGVRALGADTIVTARADTSVEGDLQLSGDGAIVSTATITGEVFVDNPGRFANGAFQPGSVLASFTNEGVIAGGFDGEARRFSNTGMIGRASLDDSAVSVGASGTLAFSNAGTIVNDGSEAAVSLETYEGRELVATNSGTITGGFEAYLSSYVFPIANAAPSASVSFSNAGTVTAVGDDGGTVQLAAELHTGTVGTLTLANTGTIEATGRSGIAAGLGVQRFGTVGDDRLIVTNAGTIRANAGGIKDLAIDPYAGASIAYPRTYPATALVLAAGTTGRAEVANAATGTIEATGEESVALSVVGGALDLANAGTIRGGAGTVLTNDDRLGTVTGQPYLAGAIQTRGVADDRIVNTGSIIGSIDLGAGGDRIDNLGRIEDDVFLRAGNDTFLQRASATLIGTVDAGEGDDLFIVDATGGGAVNGSQFINFERFTQIGEGNVAYSGTFRFDTVDVMGGTVTVAAGQTLASNGPVTISGSGAAETVDNRGTIAGGISLGEGDDRGVNRGAIGGAVLLGSGNDTFVEGPNSRVGGGVDGGAGADTYTALLAGDRAGLGARTGFERLAVEGSGTLALTLDQNFEVASLAGAGLTVALGGFTLGRVDGSDAAERFIVDGDVAAVSLGAGDDLLSLGAARASGRYDGGAGSDLLRFTATGPVMLAGTATGFEQVALAGGSLTVTGLLGSTNASLSFGDSAQALTVASGGTLAGTIDLGAGNDSFRLAAGATLTGNVAGGAGTDTATVELAGDRALAATLTGFETLASEGRGTLTLTGAHAYDQVTAATDIAVAADGSLTTRQLRFAAGDQRLTLTGRFAGSVDGGAGIDTIAVSGGSAAAPVAFTDVVGIEAFAMSGGYATVSGNADFGAVDMSAGGLVGLTGSTITGQVTVRQGATFGLAGTVNGNLAVAGILSPGASPGTMTVNGNASLSSTSLSMFELTPTAQDRLVVNGALTIASGATLQLVPTGALRPGTSYDLITASGGITGSFTTVLKPDSLFGFVVQRADRIQLLGQFLADSGFSPQVTRSVAYANSVLTQQAATSPLFAALPSLLTAGGASNGRAFAQLTPEAYASATQVGIENGLTLADVARGPGFTADRAELGAFTFAQGIGSWYRLAADQSDGVNQVRTTNYGFLGGIGYGDRDWSVGAFGGYLDSRQRIDALGASTGADGWIAGVHGHWQAAGFGFGASVAYNGAKADTQRALPGVGPGTSSATGRYDLNSWVSDVSVHYALNAGDWALTPRAGLTYLRTTRERLVEVGGPFALTVARDRHVAGFADAGVGFARNQASEAPLRPFVALGVRYQLEGRRTDALAGYAGGPLGLVALGASRARAVGTAGAGLAYRLTPALDLFSTVSVQTGRDDHRETISTGMRLRF